MSQDQTPKAPSPPVDPDWRAAWIVDDVGGSVIPHALHSSGFGLSFTYTELDEDGDWGWCAYYPAGYEEKADALRATLGQEAIDRLSEQAVQLWRELGYSDASPVKGG